MGTAYLYVILFWCILILIISRQSITCRKVIIYSEDPDIKPRVCFVNGHVFKESSWIRHHIKFICFNDLCIRSWKQIDSVTLIHEKEWESMELERFTMV